MTQYALALKQILKDTQPVWAAVRPDFEQRLIGQGAQDENTSAKVVPRHNAQRTTLAPEVDGSSEWSLARGLIHAEDPARFATWIATLTLMP